MPDIFRKMTNLLTEADQKLIFDIKTKAEELLFLIEQADAEATTLKTSREISLAKTKLEECVMWAVKDITNYV